MSNQNLSPDLIYHLAQEKEWDLAVKEGRDYVAESLEKEGFIHATSNTSLLLTIGNTFYKNVPGEWVLLTISSSALKAEVKIEEAEAPLPGMDKPPRCPHIYGTIELQAVTNVSKVRRDMSTGEFLSIDN